jgi:DNA-binding NarL/FixJ family response regulator
MKITANLGNQKQRVFLVDDHPLVREWLTNLVNQQADLAVCGEAATAAEAMQLISPSKPAVAVVDISLKDSPGIEWIKCLKQTFPNLLILVFSMHDESLYAERALQAGARGYIMKCEATKNVIEAIRRVLAGKFYLSDTMSQTITTHFVEGKTLSTHSPIERFSDRELVVFDKLGLGLGTRQIAAMLGVSIKTVQAHCVRMKEKLNVNSANELVREAVRHHETELTNLR